MADLKTLILLLKKHLNEGDSVPEFFRNLVALIVPLKKNKIGTKKDPAEKLTNTSIKSYIYRQFPKDYAQHILNCAKFKKLASRINTKSPLVRRALANDLKPYRPEADEKNVGRIAAELLEKVFQEAAGVMPSDEAEKLRQKQISENLKHKYGDLLCNENSGHCPNCGRMLFSSGTDEVYKIFEIFILDNSKEAEPDNLIALCPKCYADLQVSSDKRTIKKLKSSKKIFTSNNNVLNSIDNIMFENELSNAIIRISRLNPNDFNGSKNMNIVEIDKKISPHTDFALYNLVKNYVSVYYPKVDDIMHNLDKKKQISYSLLQCQMREIYLKLRNQKLSKADIFEKISKKMQFSTSQKSIYCDILVSYFVQKCEVFDAAS
jgi:5-methylcytosine-specific restriction endonuclease McrA